MEKNNKDKNEFWLINQMANKLNDIRNMNEELFFKALILLDTEAESLEEVDEVYFRSLNLNLMSLIHPHYLELAKDVRRGKPLESSHNEYFWMH